MPLQAASHVNAAVRGFAVGGWQQNFVLRGVLPTVPSEFETDSYHIWDQPSLLRNEALKVTATAKAPRGFFPTSTDSFTIDVYKFAWAIPTRNYANSDAAVREEMNSSRNVGQKLGIAAERAISSFLTGTAWVGATSQNAGGNWDTGGGDPIGNVETAKYGIWSKNGFRATDIVCGYGVYHWLRQHPAILERIGIRPTSGQSVVAGQGIASVTQQTLATIFDVERFTVVDGIYEAAASGATSAPTPIMGDTMVVLYSPRTATTYDAPAGVMFQLQNQYMQGEMRVRTYLEDDPEVTVTEGTTAFVCKATNLNAGALITNCLSI